MSVFGYVFLEEADSDMASVYAQQQIIQSFAEGLGERVQSFFVEEEFSLKRAFRLRKEGKKIISKIQAGDIIIAAKAEWVLGSAKEGHRLVENLFKKSVSLYCVDLGENISLPGERKLVVYDGSASLVKKLLFSLSLCESSKHGESIRATKKRMKMEGKYLGGPVPFGWKVVDDVLVVDREQQKIVQEIMQLREDRWSYRDIVGKLKEKFGLRLSHEGIRKILMKNKEIH